MPTAPTPLLDRLALDEVLREWTVESGQRLRAARSMLGWTQDKLAKLADTTPETVCRVELGSIAPRENLRITLAYSVGREVSDIWPPMSRRAVHRAAAEIEPGAVA